MDTPLLPTLTASTLLPGRCRPLAALFPQTRAKQCRLIVDAGAVWVTWPGCVEDHFLVAGQTLPLPADLRGVLIETEPRLAAGAARLSLAPVDCGPSCPALSPPPYPPPHRPSTAFPLPGRPTSR